MGLGISFSVGVSKFRPTKVFFFFNKFIYLFLAALGLYGREQRLLFVAVCGLLIVVASLVAEHGL